jgi:hypothetical protein
VCVRCGGVRGLVALGLGAHAWPHAPGGEGGVALLPRHRPTAKLVDAAMGVGERSELTVGLAG